MVTVLLLIVGLAGLYIGTRLVVGGSVELATHYRVPAFVIGLTVIALGSNLPEIVVAVVGAFQMLDGADRSDIIVGSALGSTIVQGSLVLGATGLMTIATTGRKEAGFHGSWLLVSAVLVGVLGFGGSVGRGGGVVLIVSYLVYLVWVVRAAKKEHTRAGHEIPELESGWLRERGIPWTAVLGGLGIVLVAADLTLNSAHEVAVALGIPAAVIAVTVVAIGSSLPELSVSIMGALRSTHSLGVGTILGANVLDVLLPIGLAAVIVPVTIDISFVAIEVPVIMLLAVMATVLLRREAGPGRIGGAVLLIVYIAYIAARLMV